MTDSTRERIIAALREAECFPLFAREIADVLVPLFDAAPTDAVTLTDDERELIENAIMDDRDRKEGFIVTGPGGTDGNTPTIFEAVESILSARVRVLVERAQEAEAETKALRDGVARLKASVDVVAEHQMCEGELPNNQQYQELSAVWDDAYDLVYPPKSLLPATEGTDHE